MCVKGLKYFSPTEKKKNVIPYATYPPPGLMICYILLLLLCIFLKYLNINSDILVRP